MAPRHYRNFDLVVEQADEGFRVRVSDSPAGEAEGLFTMPFGPHELENFVLKMGARRGMRRMGSAPRTAAQAFGQKLYEAVFTADVEYVLRQSLQDCQDRGDGLRVRLRLTGAPALSDLPWEYLHSNALGRPLALSVDTPVVRYMDMGLPVEPLEVAPPLRILMVAASPADLDTLDTDRELANLRAATADLVRQGRIEVHALARPTVADLQHQLRKGAFHILHFMGHGIFDEASGLGMLAFEDDDGRARPVAGVDLGMMLHDHRALQMVVLNACEGSRTSVQDPLGGVAQSLARQGVPAVIAMQFEISDGAAKRFSHELYLAIADGYPVDAAVSEARKALYLRDRNTEWGTPVLHLRAADGHIFDLTEPPPPAEVPVLLDEVDARAGGDATEEISAIGILQRILELDPDNAVAAEQLEGLQAAARRPASDDGAGERDRDVDARDEEPVPDEDVAVRDEDVVARDEGLVSDEDVAAWDEEPVPDELGTTPPASGARHVPVQHSWDPPAEHVDDGEPTSSDPVTPPPPPPTRAPPTGATTAARDDHATPLTDDDVGQGPVVPTHLPAVEPAPRRRGGRSPWPRRIGLGVLGLLALVLVPPFVAGLVDGFTDDPGIGEVTRPPDPDDSETDPPGDDGGPPAWMASLPPATMAAVSSVGPVTVDGVFDDWPTDTMAFPLEEVAGGDDVRVSAAGSAAWDDDALYVAAIVTDPVVEQSWAAEPWQLWRGDSVSFEFAFAPSDDGTATVQGGEAHVLLGPDDGNHGTLAAVNPGSGGAFRAGDVAPEIEVASVATAAGYDLEAAIPWAVLGGRPDVGEVVGFNFNVSDGDEAGDFRAMVTTTPGRTGANQPRTACWGRMLMWDDPAVTPDAAQLPRQAAAAPC